MTDRTNIVGHRRPTECDVLLFPIRRRVGAVRKAAHWLAGARTQRDADWRWGRSIETLYRHLEQAGTLTHNGQGCAAAATPYEMKLSRVGIGGVIGSRQAKWLGHKTKPQLAGAARRASVFRRFRGTFSRTQPWLRRASWAEPR